MKTARAHDPAKWKPVPTLLIAREFAVATMLVIVDQRR
jgi:hypothetical protein